MNAQAVRVAARVSAAAFAKDCLAGRPWPMSAGALEELLVKAREFRLLPTGTEQGIWQVGRAHGRRELATLAFHGAALAWHVHLCSLAARLAAACNLAPLTDTIAVLPGGGLGRGALARRLFHLRAAAGDAGLLSQCLPSPGKNAALFALASWQAVILPVWRGGQIHWTRCGRAQMHARDAGPGHGLDGCHWWRIRVPSAARLEWIPHEAGPGIFVEAMCIYHLGLLAVGEGILHGAAQHSTDFTHRRHQGGRMLEDHSAVQRSLGDIAATRAVTSDLLDSCARQPSGARNMRHILAARRLLAPLLCEAISEALQVHGGAGYLTATGLEGRLRDANQLRLMGGSARDIELFLAAVNGVPDGH